jgi:hypothetical protein
MAHVFVGGFVAGVIGLWVHKWQQHQRECLSRFLENMDRRERIRHKLYQYSQFTRDTRLVTKQDMIKSILADYEYIDPSPLTHECLGALTLLKKEEYITALDPKDWMGLVFIEFNLEFETLSRLTNQ